jgi:hypothetical protein
MIRRFTGRILILLCGPPCPQYFHFGTGQWTVQNDERAFLFTVCMLLATVWLSRAVRAQLNTFNQPQLPLNTFVGQPSAFQQPINVGFASQPNTLGLTSAAIGVSSLCDQSAQLTVTNCAQELNQLGVFTPNARGGGLGGVPQSTFDQVRRENKDYFQQICRCVCAECSSVCV